MEVVNLVFVPVTLQGGVTTVPNAAGRIRLTRVQPYNAAPTQAPE